MAADVSIIIPTYNEAENVRAIVPEISRVFEEHRLNGTVLVVDDNSPDQTWKVAEELSKSYPVRSIRRLGKRGLSRAILDGLPHARSEIVGFMDADFSHPPSQIIDLLKPILNGEADLVIGSRYMKEGRITHWPWYRRVTSKAATLLALPFTNVRDPLSGFVFFRRSVVEGIALNPVGFKMGLEIIAKGAYKKFKEVPITFENRRHGESKLSGNVIFDYIKQLWQLFWNVETTFGQFVKFCLVGFSGLGVNLMVYSAVFYQLHFHYLAAAVAAFMVAVTTNFVLNRSWTFSLRKGDRPKISTQYQRFVLVSSIGLAINLIVLYLLVTYLGMHKMFAQFLAILAATASNFLGTRKWVFYH